MKRKATLTIVAAALLLSAAAQASFAIEPERELYIQREPRYRTPLIIDVWTNKGEGAVYTPGERIRVYFRASADCHVTLYNVDTQGYVHLLYPARPYESHFVQGGATYRIPSRRDPYDLVISGPSGIEYIEAIASAAPFGPRLPWYLDPEYSEWEYEENPWTIFDDYEYYADDYDYYADIGIVRGDPFLGIQRINRRLIPENYPSADYATGFTSFYVTSRVSYPRYLCYDCHWHHPGFDSYGPGCVVFDIRIDRTWVYTPRIYVTDYRPRYYYRVKDTAPVVYKGKRHFWSSRDGLGVLKKEFSIKPPERGTWQPKAAPGGGTQWMKEPAPSGLKTWKSGKPPAYSPKLEELKRKLETQGVIKSKTYQGTVEEKRKTYEVKERETYREKEKSTVNEKTRVQEPREAQKKKSVTEKKKSVTEEKSKKDEETQSQPTKKKGSGTGKR